MAGLSNIIEEFIIDMIKEAENGIIEIQRNEMAKQFDCAPSQINYVLSTRFTPYKGYYIESRRGGSGYIRIMKVSFNEIEKIEDTLIDSIGDSITMSKAYHILEALEEEGLITKREELLIKSTLGNNILLGDSEVKNITRANILKNILLVLIKWEGRE
ncbi:MAG TPA: CtsR family transcriptional regulator [Tissierellaceae bacterium]